MLAPAGPSSGGTLTSKLPPRFSQPGLSVQNTIRREDSSASLFLVPLVSVLIVLPGGNNRRTTACHCGRRSRPRASRAASGPCRSAPVGLHADEVPALGEAGQPGDADPHEGV